MRTIELSLRTAITGEAAIQDLWLTREKTEQLFSNVWLFENNEEFEEVLIEQLERFGVSQEEFTIEDY